MAPFGQLALAFAILAPSWRVIQMSVAVGYDGLLGLIGLALSGLTMPAFTILGGVVLGMPVRLIPWVNRRWAGSGRLYDSIAAIALGLMAARS